MSQVALFRLSSKIHTFLYKVSKGVFAGLAGGSPVLLLTTVGRRSGKQFTTPLLFLTDNQNLVVVASYAGRDEDPGWWKNLQHNRPGRVQVGPHLWEVEAHQASPADKERLWPVFCRFYPNYRKYQQKTEREIPLVILKPI